MHPRKHDEVRKLRQYELSQKAVNSGKLTMKHQHHVELVERLARKGIEIAGSRFPNKTIDVIFLLRDEEIKDLKRGDPVSKQYVCKDCGAVDEYHFTMLRPGEERHWTIRSGKLPEGANELPDVRVRHGR